MRILFFGGGWPTNIGNAFIDLGAMALLRTAFPSAQIAFGSGLPRWFFRESIETLRGRYRSPLARLRRGPTRVFEPEFTWENALMPAALTDCDLAVYAGNAVTQLFIKQSGPTISALAERGVPIVLLGVGAAEYTDEERADYQAFLKKIRPLLLVSRDDRTCEMLAAAAVNARPGIDCGFFLTEAYQPLDLVLPEYVVLAFDDCPEPEVDTGSMMVVRAHHVIWSIAPESWLGHPNTLISDIPQDYLTLYANASQVHSDRVHACVAALAYGKRARLYNKTRRAYLFEAVGADGVCDELVSLDRALLDEKKAALVAFLRDVVSEQVRAA
ncbi:MAG: polysaccharide pyruvyl transferase family protein [Armatimonadota bacterium]